MFIKNILNENKIYCTFLAFLNSLRCLNGKINMKGILPCTEDYFKTAQGLLTSINHKWPPATVPSSSRSAQLRGPCLL